MPEISMIIPYLKGETYLKECVESIGGQQLTDYEILVIRDEGDGEVPEEVLKNPHVTVYHAADEISEKTRKSGDSFGVAVCRNIGIKKAAGKYIYFIDCDDYVLEGALPRLLSLAEEKKAKVTTGNCYSSWFKPMSFRFEKAERESCVEGIQPLRGAVLENRFSAGLSALHLLIDRQLLLDNEIFFEAGVTYYADMSFVVRVLQAAGTETWIDGDSLYVWRRRNDVIHLPALCQEKSDRRGYEFIRCYGRTLAYLKDREGELRNVMDHALLHFCFDHMGDCRGEAKAYSLALRKMSEWKRMRKEFDFWDRLTLRLMRAECYGLVRLSMSFNRIRKKKKGLLGSRIQWYRVLEHILFNRMPLRQDWILIESFFGRSYSDSPKYLYEYLQKTRGDKYRYIWVLDEKSPDLEKSGKHTRCKRNSLRYVYYMARCGYRIFNVRQPSWSTKRKGVVFLETWHGTPLKKLAFDMEDIPSESQRVKTMFYRHAKEWNYLISANRFSTDVFERAFVCDREKILEYGYPRNDLLYAENKEEIAAQVKGELGIPEGKRVILYAPTWRDNLRYATKKYKFKLALDLDRLRREFGEDTVVLLRTHYYIIDSLDLSMYEGFVYNGSQYEDVSRLYLASDVCITDYSSVFFDFANLKRPILFFAYDYDEYADELRGMYLDMDKELPGPTLRTNDALMDALHNLDAITEDYRERYEAFYERFCSVDDGQASRRVIEKVFGEDGVKAER